MFSTVGKIPGGGHGTPLQYSCLENPTDRGAWWAAVHSVAQSKTWLNWLSTAHVCFISTQWSMSGILLLGMEGHFPPCYWAWRVTSLHASKPFSNFLFYSMSKSWVRPTMQSPPIPSAPPLLHPHLLSLSTSFCSNQECLPPAKNTLVSGPLHPLFPRCSHLSPSICRNHHVLSLGLCLDSTLEPWREHLHRDPFLTSPLVYSVCPYDMRHQLTYYICILWFTNKRYTIINICVSPLQCVNPQILSILLSGVSLEPRTMPGTQ